MDEDLSLVNANTRNEKIKNFFVNNKKLCGVCNIVLDLGINNTLKVSLKTSEGFFRNAH